MDETIENRLLEVVESDDYLEELCELLDSGIDPNYQSTGGISLLHEAALSKENNIKVVQELIKRGAEVDFRDHLNYTALHYAVISRKLSVVNELLKSGASANTQTFIGQTPLHIAILLYKRRRNLNEDLGILRCLLQHEGINCNAKNYCGYTPLIAAITDKKEAAALLLLNKNANPNICNEFSQSPLHVAFSLPGSWIEFALLFRGVSIYSLDNCGLSPLEVLIKYGLNRRDYEWIKMIFKVIAFKYSITSGLKQKLELIPHLSQFFNECCDEVDYMRSDFILGKITMHDFVWNCFNDNDYNYHRLQIHKHVVDRLVRSFYPKYFMEILYTIPEFSMISILQMTACSKKHSTETMKDLSELLSILDIIYLFSKYLSRVEIFCLIVAFSDVKVAKSMQNFKQPNLSYVFHFKSNFKIGIYSYHPKS